MAATPSAAELENQSRRDRSFIGHPVGLAWLSGSEFWERFAYYGMQTLLVLYLTHYLLQPGHVEQVWGFGAFRRFIGWMYGTQSQMALASNTAQLYAALVYVTPLAGGYIADRLIGRTATVSIGATIMVIGTFLLALNSTFLIALLLLLAGVGCFKANIASQVGALYKINDPRRADGFQIYFLGIQLAVIISPFICGTLGQRVDWHLGFVAAGVGMVLGLAIYLAGRRNFPTEPVRTKGNHVERPPLTARDWRAVILLVALLPVLAVSIIGNQEIFDAYLVWGEKTFQTGWFIESVTSAALIVLVVRTRLPFVKSPPGKWLAAATGAIILFVLALPVTPLAGLFGFSPLPLVYYGWIGLIVAGYVGSAELLKHWFYRRFGQS